GSAGGACMTTAGCYGSETKDALVEAYAVTRSGERRTLSNADLGFSYRKSARAAEGDLIFTGALFRGRPDDPAAITARMDEITARREQTQPIREKTSGSTFKNPPGDSSWRLVDAAGWRGKPYGVAMFAPLHANFHSGAATPGGGGLEGLGDGDSVVCTRSLGVDLRWVNKWLGRR